MDKTPEEIKAAATEPVDEKKPDNRLSEAKAKFAELLQKQQAATAPKEPAEEAPAEAQESKEEPKAEAAPEKEKPKARDAGVEKLRNKLLLAGNPKRAVESLDDEEVSEWWKRQEERERTAALALQRASDLEKQLAQKAAGQDEEPLGVPTSDEPDLDELTSSLTEQFGEDEAKALTGAMKAILSPVLKENAEIKRVIAEAQRMGREQTDSKNRSRLAKELPALKESDAAWKSIQRDAHERYNREPQKYASPDEAYSEAFQELYGAVLPAKGSSPDEADSGKAKARIAASSHSAPNSQKAPKSYRPVDAARAAFDHLLKNPGDKDGARNVFGRLTA